MLVYLVVCSACDAALLLALLLAALVSCDLVFFFFFQAEDGIRDLVRSRGLGDVYKRQEERYTQRLGGRSVDDETESDPSSDPPESATPAQPLSLIHI